MLIEIVGVDGSGKTTLIHGARKRINESGIAFAYERPFQSEGVRLLEASVSDNGRCRPYKIFGHAIVETVRTVDLVGRSALLNVYKDSKVQHVFCDAYIIEQYGRFIQFDLATQENLNLLKFAIQPDLLIYLRLSAHQAVERMKSRIKGDALLLENDPISATQKVINALEKAIVDSGKKVIELDANQQIEEVLECFMQVFAEAANRE